MNSPQESESGANPSSDTGKRKRTTNARGTSFPHARITRGRTQPTHVSAHNKNTSQSS